MNITVPVIKLKAPLMKIGNIFTNNNIALPLTNNENQAETTISETLNCNSIKANNPSDKIVNIGDTLLTEVKYKQKNTSNKPNVSRNDKNHRVAAAGYVSESIKESKYKSEFGDLRVHKNRCDKIKSNINRNKQLQNCVKGQSMTESLRVYTNPHKRNNNSGMSMQANPDQNTSAINNILQSTAIAPTSIETNTDFQIKQEPMETLEIDEIKPENIDTVPNDITVTSYNDFEENMEAFAIRNDSCEGNKLKRDGDKFNTSETDDGLTNFQPEPVEKLVENTQKSNNEVLKIMTEGCTVYIQTDETVQTMFKNGQLVIKFAGRDENQSLVIGQDSTVEDQNTAEAVPSSSPIHDNLVQSPEMSIKAESNVQNRNKNTVGVVTNPAPKQNNSGHSPKVSIKTKCNDQNKNNIKKQKKRLQKTEAPKEKDDDSDQYIRNIAEFSCLDLPLTSRKKSKKIAVDHICKFCETKFIDYATLRKHRRACHKKPKVMEKKIMKKLEEPILCEMCSKVFYSRQRYYIHKKIHREKKYECDVCHKRFTQRFVLRNHKFIHINPINCSHCDFIFRDRDTFELHKTDGLCPMLPAWELIMKWKKMGVTTEDLEVYLCELCEAAYQSESELDNHILTMHVQEPTNLHCFECGQHASNKTELQTHLVSHKKPYATAAPCELCHVVCESRGSLQVHMRVHTGERPYQCHLCPSTFKTNIHLKNHQLVHTKEKKFVCPECNKSFALKGNMVAHLRSHTGEKPYMCVICRESFKDTKFLKKHREAYHADSRMPWEEYLLVSKSRASSLALTKKHIRTEFLETQSEKLFPNDQSE